MNSDSFQVFRSDYPSGHPFQTQALALTTTAEQLFQISGANTAIIAAPNQTSILGAMSPFDPNSPNTMSANQIGMRPFGFNPRPFFNSTSFSGRAFRVRATGTFTNQAGTTNAQTVTVRIRQGTNASGNLVAVVAGATNTSASGNFFLESTIMWDNASQYLFPAEYWGAVVAQTGSVYQARTVGAGSSFNVTAYTALQFVATCQVGTSNATSTASLVEFSMETV